MKKSNSPSLLAAFLGLSVFATAAYAQKPVARTNINMNASSSGNWATCTDYLQCAQAMARADLEATLQAITAMSKETANFDVCAATELRIRRAYDQWFLDHLSDLSEVDATFNRLNQNIEKKLTQIKNSVVEVNPVEGQKAAAVKVDFPQIVQYFKTLNARLTTCDPNKRDALLKLQEDPAMTGLGISHSQILAAMQRLTTNLNASLKEGAETYELVFNSTSGLYDLDFHVAASIQGASSNYHLSMLSENQSFKAISEAAKWRAAYDSKAKIGKYSIDGISRYWEMHKEFGSDACPSDNVIGRLFMSHGFPYDTPAAINGAAKNAAASAIGQIELVPVYAATNDNDHFLTLVANEGAPYYVFESKPAFYVAKNPIHGIDMFPIYRCLSGRDHFVSSDPSCEGANAEGIYGYIFKTSISESLVQVKRYYSSALARHYFGPTPNFSGHEGFSPEAAPEGYVFIESP